MNKILTVVLIKCMLRHVMLPFCHGALKLDPVCFVCNTFTLKSLIILYCNVLMIAAPASSGERGMEEEKYGGVNERRRNFLQKDPHAARKCTLWASIWIVKAFKYRTVIFKQEGPEGPGTLTWEWRFLRFPFFHCFIYNRWHLGGGSKSEVMFKKEFSKILPGAQFLTWHDPYSNLA